MDVKHLLLDFGPLVILVWTFFEGETVLLVAGFLAHQGYISLEWSILAAFVGSTSGDQLYFWIGRKFGEQILDWRPAWRVRIERPLRLLVRYQNLFILSFRFIYVVRNVASFSIGLAGVSFRRFTILNAIAAAIWALSFGLGGYWFGSTLETVAGGVQEIETVAVVVVALALVAYFVWRRRRRRDAAKGRGGLREATGDE
ncbi:MAG TPA: DedA family protein [Alphaproteobacteria bacterium]|nr:DedA family protein [Alphaproteobacteria bacterium]